ncbi:hypothetical protein Tco_0446550, partial [Tanacetum coccineum]
ACAQLKFGFHFQALVASLKFLVPWFIANCLLLVPSVASEQCELPSNVEHDFELDDAAVGCTRDILRQRDCLDWLSKIPWVVPTSVVIEGERLSLMLLEHKDIVAEFCSPSWWKELSKETSSTILPYGDGSCWNTFKPIASLIAKEKLK